MAMDADFGGFGGFSGGLSGGMASGAVMPLGGITALGPRQKAAIIVRLILGDGEELNLAALPPDIQARLAQDMASMDLIDRRTRDAVIEEFCDKLEAVGVSFPGTLDGALDLLAEHLSDDTTNRLRRLAVLSGNADPWARIASLNPEQLAQLAGTEAEEIAAVMFSRLPVQRAAEVLALLDPGRARRIAYAMSLTAGIDAEGMRRVGMALMRAVDALPRPVLTGKADEKVGAILNYAPSVMRDTVLEGLDQDDAVFAGEVRRAIFTFASVRTRVEIRDIPRVLRGIDGPVVVKALAGATAAGGENALSAEFILSALSTRMADSLREEMAEAGRISARDVEDAMTAIVTEIRRMESEGDLFLIVPDD